MARGKYKQWITPSGLKKLEDWAKKGYTDEQIAKKLGINRTTLYVWEKRYPDIADALNRGKKVSDDKAEAALEKIIGGMVVKEKTYRMVKVDPDKVKARRAQYINAWKLDHPTATENEIKDAMFAAVEKIPTMEKIQISQVEREVPPNVSALIFFLKNRRPDLYRDQGQADLAAAQVEKTKADARRANAEADIAELKRRLMSGDDAEKKLGDMLKKLDDAIGND